MSEENNQNDEKPKESLEDLARKRKERLQQLRNRAQNHGTSDDKNSIPLPKPVFRNYKPQDEKLKEAVLPDADPENVEEVVKDQLEAAKSKVVIDELDITNLAPRKPDWDLKRDVAKKLEKLERRTQKAIAELIWERVKQGQETNIGAVINMTATDTKSTS